MNDYPNEGDALIEAEAWTPEKPEERKEQEESEQAMVNTSVGVIKDVLEWLEAIKQDTDSLSAARHKAQQTGNSLDEVGIAFDILNKLVTDKQAEFKTLFDKHLTKEPADEA
jgi:hypothetical protein